MLALAMASLGPSRAAAAERELVTWVPADLDEGEGDGFDVVVHFHGAAERQEENAKEAGLRAAIVTVNEGVGTTPYARAFAPQGSLERALDAARRAVGKGSVRRVALSSWSAGGAAVRAVLANDAERIDAVLLADGIFSRWADDAERTVEPEPLEPFVAFARRAAAGEALMVVTHTAIATPGYPDVKECTDFVLEAIGIAPSEEAVYALDRGGLHVRGSAGTGPRDHVAEIEGLDAAYARLARRWQRP